MPSRPRARRAPRLDLDVTEEIIALAIPQDSSHCMIADAVKAAVPNATYIAVDLATIRFTDPTAGMRYIYLTPRAGQLALLSFDQGEKPEPFTMRGIRAAQMVATRKAVTAGDDADVPKTRTPATIERVDRRDGPGSVGVKVGGNTPPLGPLAATADNNKSRRAQAEKNAVRTGKRRTFGIRAMGR